MFKFLLLGCLLFGGAQPLLATDPGPTVSAKQSGLWTVDANVTGTTGRSWSLSSGTDSIAAVQSGAWTTGRTWTLSNGTDSIAAVQSGNWPVRLQDGSGNSITSTSNKLDVQVGNSTLAVTQSTSPWVTSRNWTLASGSDSISAVQSGTWTVQPGNTANTIPWLATLNQGGNSATVTAGNALKVDGSAVTQPISGTVTANQGGTWNVNNISGTVSLPTGASTAANQSTIISSLSTIDAGIPAALGQTTMANSMPVVIASNQTTIPTSIVDVFPATQSITAVDVGTTSLSGANSQVFYFGTPTANSSATFALSSIDTVSVESSILGTGGTLVVEVSMDGGSFWFRPNVYQVSTQSYTNSFTLPFMAIVNTAGMTNIRVRAITSWSGTATIRVNESQNNRHVTIGDALPAGANTIGSVSQNGTWTTGRTWTLSSGTDSVAATQSGTWTVQQGSTPTAVANAWPVKVTDGTNTLPTMDTVGRAAFVKITDGTDSAEVKPASTAPVASDPALVVSISPNSATNVGTKVALTANSPAAATVGTSSAQALASNSSRKGLILTNTSNNKISIGIGAAAVLNSGITLYPGGVFVMDEYNYATGAINAIASAASSNLAIQEFQ